MPRRFATSRRSRFNNSWCKCRRNCDWTSATIYYGENLLEIMELKSKFLHRLVQATFLGRGMNRYLDDVLVPKSEYNNVSKDLITERAVENTEPEWGQSCTEEARVTSRVRVQKKQYATLKTQFPSEKESGKFVLSSRDTILLLTPQFRCS